MQKFFTNSIESKFIKALLYNTDIPMIDCVVDNDFIFSGYYYIYKNYLILCTETGNLSNNFKIINNFYFKDKKDNITEKYINKYQYYDSETHLYLGKYLRYLKAEKGIDLMPFYNCFNYTTISAQSQHKKSAPEHIPESGFVFLVNNPCSAAQKP